MRINIGLWGSKFSTIWSLRGVLSIPQHSCSTKPHQTSYEGLKKLKGIGSSSRIAYLGKMNLAHLRSWPPPESLALINSSICGTEHRQGARKRRSRQINSTIRTSSNQRTFLSNCQHRTTNAPPLRPIFCRRGPWLTKTSESDDFGY